MDNDENMIHFRQYFVLSWNVIHVCMITGKVIIHIRYITYFMYSHDNTPTKNVQLRKTTQCYFPGRSVFFLGKEHPPQVFFSWQCFFPPTPAPFCWHWLGDDTLTPVDKEDNWRPAAASLRHVALISIWLPPFEAPLFRSIKWHRL